MTVKRNTWQREAVRAALAEAHGFTSAQKLHDRLRAAGSAIGLATVYRSLSVLVELGEADTINSPEGENLFRICQSGSHHHHLICRICGVTKEIAATAVESWAEKIAAENGYSDTSHIVDIFGVCQRCNTDPPK